MAKLLYTNDNKRAQKSASKVDFKAMACDALAVGQSIVQQLLPGGRIDGHEYVALNPHRSDKNLGSFKINLQTGQWKDFASDDRGGDLISLAAFVRQESQLLAANWLMEQYGLGGRA